MEEVEFKVENYKKDLFENDFKNVLNDKKIICNQWESTEKKDCHLFLIPKSCIDKLSKNDLSILNSHTI
jgi:hypothetical protein